MSVFRVTILRVCGRVEIDVPVDDAKTLGDGTKLPAEGQFAATKKAVDWIRANEVESRRLFDESQRREPGVVTIEHMPYDAVLLDTEEQKAARLARAQKEMESRPSEM